MAALFVLVWGQTLKLCQLAERPIQKKISCVSIPKIITHSILPPDTHTHYKPGSYSKKQERARVCVHAQTHW